MRCRICRTARNLKFTPQQLLSQSKTRNNKNKLRLPLSAIPQTTGNICFDCDERLQNFHQLEDDSVDIVVDVDSNGFHESKIRHVDIPIVVDDDQRLFDIFYNKTALQCNEAPTAPCRSLGSDGDAEVIELTSRETTPDVVTGFSCNEIPNSIALATNHNVVDVIDLENYDETGKEYSETSSQCNKSANSTQSETRLLGCLNLVSSDSESEINFEPCPPEGESHVKIGDDLQNARSLTENLNQIMDGAVECTNNNNLNCKNSSVTIQHNLPVCGVCGISFLDKQSLQAHMKDHEGFKCPACNANFQIPLDLVNHMRKKHRSYNGSDLCEGARCSQDSAMTIRLRFMQQFTFYECQLCGQIESKFKTHKTHIIQKHADESKSLKDPMMKTQLKCPSCHQNCGTQQIDICRHLLTRHEPSECNKYLQEVTDITMLGLNSKLLQSLQHSTRFLTLGEQKQLFFECLLCNKAFGNVRSFSSHQNGHNIDEWKNFRSEETKATPVTSPIKPKRGLKRKIETQNAIANSDNTKSDAFLKKEDQPPSKKTKLEYEKPVKNPVKPKRNAMPKDSKAKTEDVAAKKLTTSKQTPNIIKTEFLSPPDMKRQKKLKHKLERKSQNKRGQAKAITKVKVKPPLRHFPTQKYNCKHCQLQLKGFRKLQMHLLSSHRLEEYHGCENCTRAFTTKASLEIHRAQNICRRKRKCTTMLRASNDNDNLDENSNKEHRKSCKYELKPTDKELPNIKKHQKHKTLTTTDSDYWLKEILQLSREKTLSNIKNPNTAIDDSYDEPYPRPEQDPFNTTMQTLCRFCGSLFPTVEKLSLHEKNHITLKDMPWIHYSQTKLECSST